MAMGFRKAAAALVCAAALACGSGLPAHATEVEDTTSDEAVVDGRTFGPADGLTVVEESYVLDRDSDDRVGSEWGTTPPKGESTTDAAWGASYAFSEHPSDLTYYGYAHAAGNIYQQQRIIKVCFWYTQGTRTGATTCSSATSTGTSWKPGYHVGAPFADSLDPNAPQTVFNIKTTRISPNIY